MYKVGGSPKKMMGIDVIHLSGHIVENVYYLYLPVAIDNSEELLPEGICKKSPS